MNATRKRGQRRTFKILFIVAAVLLVLAVTLAIALRGQINELMTLASFRKVSDFPLYVMTYSGSYGFDEFLRKGIPVRTDDTQSSRPEAEIGLACTCFSALDKEGHRVFGRNFDWKDRASLLLFTHAPGAYATVSMVDMAYLGYGVEPPPLSERRGLLDAPYIPFDGMNEYGLTVGMMALSYVKPATDPQKVTIGSLHVMRLILDYAKDVDEAVSLLQKYNVDFAGGPPLHYLVADSSGNSAVIEYFGGEIQIIRNTEPWQVATNFTLWKTTLDEAISSCWRYQTVYETLSQASGLPSEQGAMVLLKRVSQASTQWSIVYNMSTGGIQVAPLQRYDRVQTFDLQMRKK